MALNEDEKILFTKLLKKVDNNQIRGDTWYEFVKKFINVAIELCIFDKQNRVFLVYRKDREFDGYHIPGTVINDWETVGQACERLVKTEIIQSAGLNITKPVSIGWFETARGNGFGENQSRHVISLLHVAYFFGSIPDKEDEGFFSFSSLPENTLKCQDLLIQKFRKFSEDGQLICGE